MLNELDKGITMHQQGVATNDLPSSGQIVLKVTNFDSMLYFLYLQRIRVTSVILLLYH
jgi:hypothetical protein